MKIIPIGGSGGVSPLPPPDYNSLFLTQYKPKNANFGSFRRGPELEGYIQGFGLNTYGLLPTDAGFVSIPRSMHYTTYDGTSTKTISKIFDYFIIDGILYMLGENTDGEGIVIMDNLEDTINLVEVRPPLADYQSSFLNRFFAISAGYYYYNNDILLVWSNSSDSSLMVGSLFGNFGDTSLIASFEGIAGVNAYRNYYILPNDSSVFPIHVFGRFRVAVLDYNLNYRTFDYYSVDGIDINAYSSAARMSYVILNNESDVIRYINEEKLTFRFSYISSIYDFVQDAVCSFAIPWSPIFIGQSLSPDFAFFTVRSGGVVFTSIVIDNFGQVYERNYSDFKVKEVRPIKYFNKDILAILILDVNGTDMPALMSL